MTEANGVPFDHDEARRIAAPALELATSVGIEVLISGSNVALTRFAGSEIIQNTVRNSLRTYVRATKDTRSASAATERLDADGIMKATRSALDAIGALPSDPDFAELPTPDEVGSAEGILRWDDETAATPPSTRADSVVEILNAAEEADAAGVIETGAHALAVVSSTGIDCFDAYTRCTASCLADLGDSTGWAEAWSHKVSSIQPGALGEEALAKAKAGRDPVDATPGRYEVVLEPLAVAVMLEYLSYIGFGAKQMIEGESFLATRAGTQVAAPCVTLSDDAYHPMSIGIGFDFEGVPRGRVDIVEGGIARGPVTDRRTARRLGVVSTGHASGSNEFGPYASNVVMLPGDSSFEDLIAGLEHGLLITRFHYVNVLDRSRTTLTGMTRDGTFLIERGEVTGPVRNLRFADSVLDVLSSVVAVGSELRSFGPEWGSFGSTVAPAVHAGSFRFTSTTSH